jgi:hypothetical protein
MTFMRSRISLGATAFAVAAFGGFFEGLPDRTLGVRSAEARDYYTRKRVNGRWITGRFPKDSAGKSTGVKRPSPKPDVLRFSATPPADPEPRPAQASPLARPAPDASSSAPAPEPLAPPPGSEPLLRLRAALESHARTLATGSLSAAPAEDGAGSPASPKPRAVSFDLQTGVKRTTFSDGSVLEEEFDIEAMRQVATQGNEPRGPETRTAP